MLLVCSWSFHATGQVPVGVGFVAPPWVMVTGPRVTVPWFISHACFVDRLTQALMPRPHGGGCGGGGASAVTWDVTSVVVVGVAGGWVWLGVGPAAAFVAQPASSATASSASPASPSLMATFRDDRGHH
jgi:hypothetical protein